ncbi:MAG: hypothetical protein JWL88_522 [Parcubacteria group bacterium]|nr:hypothetical protein [Parcubacteria group bacterium]
MNLRHLTAGFLLLAIVTLPASAAQAKEKTGKSDNSALVREVTKELKAAEKDSPVTVTTRATNADSKKTAAAASVPVVSAPAAATTTKPVPVVAAKATSTPIANAVPGNIVKGTPIGGNAAASIAGIQQLFSPSSAYHPTHFTPATTRMLFAAALALAAIGIAFLADPLRSSLRSFDRWSGDATHQQHVPVTR